MIHFLFSPFIFGYFYYFYPEFRKILSLACLTIIVSMYKNFCILAQLYRIIRNGQIRNILKDYIIFNIIHSALSKLEVGRHQPVNKKMATVSYYYGNEVYKIRFLKKRGIKNILSVSHFDDFGNETDITNYIRPYLGPHYDFHSIPTTPSLLGYNTGVLSVKYRNRSTQIYNPDEKIFI